MLTELFLIGYYLFFVPLIMVCIFGVSYRHGFQRSGLKSAIMHSLLWSAPPILLLTLGVFYSLPAPPLDDGPPGPGDGLIALFMIGFLTFPGFIIITFIAYKGFMYGYTKAIPGGYVSKHKPVNPFMILLSTLCLLLLLSGAVIHYQR